MTNATDARRTVKEIYKNSCERISLALKLYGPAAKDSPARLHAERECETIRNLVNSVVGSQKFEEPNDYRAAIQDTGTWILKAYSPEFFEQHSNHAPSVLYVVKRGMEVLHALLHRDLRRRQLSSTESQIYFEFKALLKPLPDPRKEPLSQGDVDATIAEMNRKLG
jgi:hypothetical protein